jgi:hypothetical protein
MPVVLQNRPAGQGAHAAASAPPSAGPYVPLAQGTGDGAPVGQYAPAGHGPPAGAPGAWKVFTVPAGGVGVQDPPAHQNPAVHGPDTPPSVPLQNDPAGQGRRDAAPGGQKSPGPHGPPAAPGPGADEFAPPRQYHPPAHSPAGAVPPTPGQYDPGSQGMHAAAVIAPVTLLYVPGGHGAASARAVPGGQ